MQSKTRTGVYGFQNFDAYEVLVEKPQMKHIRSLCDSWNLCPYKMDSEAHFIVHFQIHALKILVMLLKKQDCFI